MINDADINAAINIAKMSKLPVSQTSNLTYGQAIVNSPNEYKPLTSVGAVQAQYADFCAGKKRQGNLCKYVFFGRNDLADPVH